ncbi:amidohydrolase [Acinetobacter populi]|uniref:Amidohydrolase 3 domain-containing protein n=1 Tax=Acinetobacter populi TaxID=1582270 RepID=A0A1Z9YU53_9GAMM|nr:amidohydrolase [Acinetobacter populi]OUY05721.1 hypothetical protein CAP51_15950 [Acinetobacter populi]
MQHHHNYILSNILLEVGFEYDDLGEVQATKTRTVALHIQEGKIVGIYFDALPETLMALPHIDGQGYLALPGIQDAHIHLDKTYYGGTWQAAEQDKSVAEMIAMEKQLLPRQLPVVEQRAQAILDLIISKGAVKTLAHCNVDHSIGVEHFLKTQQVLQQYRSRICGQIVAFPQHGLYRDNTVALMQQVLQLGCDYVGGIDPQTLDGDRQKSLETTFQLALDYKVGIDLHLHERGEVGKQTLKLILRLIEENPQLKNKFHLSHGFVIYDIAQDGELEEYAEQMKRLGITLISGVPIQFRMPLAELHQLGVKVQVGTDSVMDHWYPFGQGDIIERSNVIAQLYGWKNEYSLSRALYFATGILPLNQHGERQWPQIQDAADIMLVQASCSAEAIARVSMRKMTIYRGQVTYQEK